MNKYFITTISLTIYFLVSECFTLSVNFSGANVNPDAKTFSVIEFMNRAEIIEPSLALEITEALRDKVESQTPLRMINGYGDITFEGEIYKYNVTSKQMTANEVAAENRFTIGIKVKYTNLLDPETDFEKSFERSEDFPGSESIESVKDEKTELIIANLIDDIFKEAFVNW